MTQSDPVPARRLLLVHAHPDDETITTGATMAHYAAQGVGVTVVTCTLGEQGEILVPQYAQLEAEQADQLGGLRIGELAAAMRALGVADHRFLGGAGRFRDSGMMGTDANHHDRAFWRANDDPATFGAAVTAVVAVIRETRPQVVVTYDDFGDYGHPDHIMANRVTTAAVLAAADPAHPGGPTWDVEKFYWTATPRSAITAGYEEIVRRGDVAFDTAAEPAFGVADDVVTTVVAAGEQVDAKRAALAAHATQVLVDGDFFALSNRLGRRLDGVEHYRLVRGELGETGPDGVERDLFAGGDEVSNAAGWVGVALVTVSAAFAAWLESLLVPYYVGSVVLPVAIVFALASNWFLPRLARALVPATIAAVLPFLAWLAVIFLFSAAGTSEGDVILPGGGGAVEYIGYGVMFGGALVGTISIISSAPLPERRPQSASGSSR